MGCLEADLLRAEVIEGAHEEARPAEEKDTEPNLHADGNLAEALRASGGSACILAQSIGEIGVQEMEDRRHAEHESR